MAIKVNTKREYTYIPTFERGDKKPFTVTFRLLTSSELAYLENNLVKLSQEGDGGINIQTGTYNLTAVKLALKNWKNVTDDKNKEVSLEFDEKGLVKDECIQVLPFEYIQELAAVIVGCSKFPSEVDIYLGTGKVE